MKKLLLVAVSVGVFLVVIISAAILLLTPKVQTQETAFSSSRPISLGWSEAENTQNINNQQAQVLNDVPAESTADSRDDKPVAAAVSDRIDEDKVTLIVPKPNAAAVPDTATNNSKPQAKTTKPAANTAPAKTESAKPAAKPAQTASKQQKNDYWVQTGAFTAKIRAEDAKELLASKGITSIIENRLVDGKTWYRVRLGPYTSEKEANYWLALVQSIDGFSESQVRQSMR